MRQPDVVLTIAGSDSSGGAGIQADIKTISALGGYAASIITAVTAQNTLGVQEIFPMPPNMVKKQLTAVMEDLQPKSVKIGMIYDTDTAQVITGALKKYRPTFVIYDPVMVSTSGRRLMAVSAIQYIQDELFPLCTLVTPNLNEASLLCGTTLNNTDQMKTYGKMLSMRYNTNVLIKGGHLNSCFMNDILCTTEGTCREYTTSKIISQNLHGTGCTLSSAIATILLKDIPLDKAVDEAKKYITRAIEESKEWHIGKGNGPLCHFF